MHDVTVWNGACLVKVNSTKMGLTGLHNFYHVVTLAHSFALTSISFSEHHLVWDIIGGSSKVSFNGGCCAIKYYCFVSMAITSLCTNIPQEEGISKLYAEHTAFFVITNLLCLHD